MTRLGVSSSRAFSVGTLPEVTRDKPNNSSATAMPLTPNVVCNAFVNAKAVDYYVVQATKGKRLIVDCAAAGIDSKLTAVLIVADSAGHDLLVESPRRRFGLHRSGRRRLLHQGAGPDLSRRRRLLLSARLAGGRRRRSRSTTAFHGDGELVLVGAGRQIWPSRDRGGRTQQQAERSAERSRFPARSRAVFFLPETSTLSSSRPGRGSSGGSKSFPSVWDCPRIRSSWCSA